ncbi:MAG: hypothetical protein YPKNTGVA_002512 [Candidatus Fervidibacter sp.]
MTEQEILELIRRHLPRLLQESPEVREWVRELVAEYGVTREEWNALLQRLDRLTEALERLQVAFEALRAEFEQLREEFRQTREAHERQIQLLWEEVRQLREEVSLLREEVRETRETHDKAIAGLWEEIRLLRETYDRAIAELRQALERAVSRLERRMDAIGARFGLLAESAFRDGMRGILQEHVGLRVVQWRYYDEQGIVHGFPSWVEADLLITDDEHWLVEIKAHFSRADIAEFYRIGQLYQQVTGVAPRLIGIAPSVDERAKEWAQRFGITLYGDPEEVTLP